MFSTTNSLFSTRLREGTRESHRLAESMPFMRELFSARLPISSYRLFLIQLYRIYSALEECSKDLCSDDHLQTFYLPALFRCAALEEDLYFYFGDDRWREIKPLKATQIYVHRVQTISKEWLIGLIAHQYTRYLGDLSGGQAMKRIVAKMYHLETEQGLAFYNFPQIPDHTAFKNEYRAKLDALPMNELTAQKIVDEANVAFELNCRVFAEMMEVADPTPP